MWWTPNNSVWHNSQPTERANVNRWKTFNWQEIIWGRKLQSLPTKMINLSCDKFVSFPGGSVILICELCCLLLKIATSQSIKCPERKTAFSLDQFFPWSVSWYHFCCCCWGRVVLSCFGQFLGFRGVKVWGFVCLFLRFFYTTTHHISGTKFKVSAKLNGNRSLDTVRLCATHKFN